MKIHQLTNLEASSMATTQIEHGYHHLTASEIASVSANSPNASAPALFHVSFNYNSSCFAVGTDRGYRLYSCDPFREVFRRSSGGIGVFEILLHSNILALVGGGPDPHCPANRVMLVDDSQRRTIGQLCYRAKVRGVRLRRDHIVVVLEQNVFVYNYADMRRLHHLTTVQNPKGLCEVSHAAGANMVLACPGLYKGQVRVEHYGFYKRTRLIMAHDSGIACLAINQDGSLLATSSTKGTLVRVFNTLDGTFLQEVRRGADQAEIYSMAFSPTAPWLAVSSDKGTVHVFSLKINSPNPSNESSSTGTEANNLHSQFEASLSFIKGVLPKYFSSEWSMARFRLSERSRCVVTFGHQKNTVVILGMDGSFYRCKFDPVKGGQMIQLEHHNFLAQNQSQLDS